MHQEELKSAFDLFDKNKDGILSTAELGSVLKNIGLSPTEEELNDIINEVDMDGNGTIDYDEFLKLLSRSKSEQDDLLTTFNLFDFGKKGYIEVKDIMQLYEGFGVMMKLKEAKDIIAQLDLDKDGKVNFEDFKATYQDKLLTPIASENPLELNE